MSCFPCFREEPNALLLKSAAAGDVDGVQRALARGADIEARDETFGGTPLGLAALNGKIEVMEILLQQRPLPNLGARDRVGDSPVHWAALNGYPGAVALLLAHGADPGWRNFDGDSPLEMAGRGVGVTAANAEAVRVVLRRAAPREHHLQAASVDSSSVVFRLPGEEHRATVDVGPDWELDTTKLQYAEKIASGSFGDVFRGTYCGSDVAIKVLRLSVGGNSAALVREFAHELSVLRRVRHKHVVQLIGALASPACVLVTELMPRGSLADYLRTACGPPADIRTNGIGNGNGAAYAPQRRLPPERQVKLLLDVARGMDYLHQCGVIHRDLKSANLLLSEHGDVKVADFGLARMVDGATATMTAETGTYRWMAPEVVLHQSYDHKCDVFSFGVVSWEVATGGRLPYAGLPTLRVAIGVAKEGLRPDIPSDAHPPLARLMPLCWAQDPAERPEFSAVAAALEVALEAAAVAAAAAAGGDGGSMAVSAPASAAGGAGGRGAEGAPAPESAPAGPAAA